jgi:hypothetical protein
MRSKQCQCAFSLYCDGGPADPMVEVLERRRVVEGQKTNGQRIHVGIHMIFK